MSRTRILSIDGGGIKGIVPAVVLLHLEKLLKQLSKSQNSRIHDYFDLFSGASTGAIIISGLLSPDKNNHPKYSPEEILDLYLENGHIIFKNETFPKILIYINGKKLLLVPIFIIFAFGWHPKATLSEDIGSLPGYRIPYKATKFINTIKIRFQNNEYKIAK